MMRRKRCVDCGKSFYCQHTDTTIHCQDCTGETPDKTVQATKEAALITKANSQPKDREQIVNPRSGKSPKQEKAVVADDKLPE